MDHPNQTWICPFHLPPDSNRRNGTHARFLLRASPHGRPYKTLGRPDRCPGETPSLSPFQIRWTTFSLRGRSLAMTRTSSSTPATSTHLEKRAAVRPDTLDMRTWNTHKARAEWVLEIPVKQRKVVACRQIHETFAGGCTWTHARVG